MKIHIKTVNLKHIYLEYIAAALLFFDSSAILTIGYVLNRFGLRGEYPKKIVFYTMIAVIVLLFWLFNKLEKKSLLAVGSLLCFLLFYFAYGFTFFQKNFKSDISGFSAVKLFLYFPVVVSVFLRCDDREKLLKYLIFFARIFAITAIIGFYSSYSDAGSTYSSIGYDMVGGYRAALCALPLMYSLGRKLNLYDLMMSIVLTALAAFGGSRGSLLVICVYLALGIFNKYILEKKAIFRILFCLLAGIIIYVIYKYYIVMITFLIKWLGQFGINSRTLNRFITNRITSDSGRSVLRRQVISTWKDMPLIGYGLLGDRYVNGGIYVHNLFLEFLTDFGIPIGLTVSILLVYGIAVRLIKKGSRSVTLILVSYCGVMLMLSGTYLTSTLFFALLGVIFSGSRQSYNEQSNVPRE